MLWPPLPLPYSDGGSPQWVGGDQFSVVTTVHAGATTPTDMGPPPGQFLSPMAHPNSVSYTTSPHALGSAQWAPPNANLFPQNNVQGHVAGGPKPAAPPNMAYSNQQGGPAFDGGPAVGDPGRSQGSNLSAAAAAAAAVMAAATATAHATATLTLKPGEMRVQSQGFDGVAPTPPAPPPPLHPPALHSSYSTPSQQQMQQQQQMMLTSPHQVRDMYITSCMSSLFQFQLV